MSILLGDLPPAYSSLNLSPEQVSITANMEHGLAPLIGKSFEEKNARIMFTQKVLAIVLLQSVGVGIVLKIFALYRINRGHELIGVAVVVYLITIFVMACIDQVKNRKIYNYIILVFYPITSTFVIVLVPTLFNVYLLGKLRQSFMCAWMSYILGNIYVLLYCIFSLDCKHGFKLLEKYIITASAFIAAYFGLYIPLSVNDADFDPISTLWITVSLFMYYLYVLYAVDVMTSGDYRSPLTPADHVTGAVNVQIDFLFIIRDFFKRKCC